MDGRAAGPPARPVVVAHVIPRLSVAGGIQIAVRGLARAVDPSVVELHVISCRPELERDRLDEVPAAFHPLDHTRAGHRLRDRLRLLVGVARLVRSTGADVVHLHSGSAWLGLLARLTSRRAAFVLEIHDAPGSGHRGEGSHRFEGWMVRRLGMVALCHSAQVVDAVTASYRPPPGGVRMFPLGVDTDLFRPLSETDRERWRERHGVGPGTLLAVAVGRGAPSKRFDLAIDAVAAARRAGSDVELLVIGPGERLDLAGHARDRGVGDHVRVVGGMPRSDLAAAIGAADVLVSTSEYESFGLTVIEGMATARPVVAVGVGGVLDLVTEGVTGHLAAPGDVATVADRLVALADDPAQRERLGRAGRELAVARFGMTTVARHFADLYVELARRS